MEPLGQLSKEDAFEALHNALDDIGDNNPNASFAATGIASNAANPGLFIESLGGIGLPLSDHDAQRLQSSSAGKITGKMVQLMPSQFQLQNPAWAGTLDRVVAQALDGLGISSELENVRAEVCGLHFYKEGAFYDWHAGLV